MMITMNELTHSQRVRSHNWLWIAMSCAPVCCWSVSLSIHTDTLQNLFFGVRWDCSPWPAGFPWDRLGLGCFLQSVITSSRNSDQWCHWNVNVVSKLSTVMGEGFDEDHNCNLREVISLGNSRVAFSFEKKCFCRRTHAQIGIVCFQLLVVSPDLMKPDIHIIRITFRGFPSSAAKFGVFSTFALHQTCYWRVLSCYCLDIRCQHFRTVQPHFYIVFPFMRVVELNSEQSQSLRQQPLDLLHNGDCPDREFRGMVFGLSHMHCMTRHLFWSSSQFRFPCWPDSENVHSFISSSSRSNLSMSVSKDMCSFLAQLGLLQSDRSKVSKKWMWLFQKIAMLLFLLLDFANTLL
jgi:hypothetical protein